MNKCQIIYALFCPIVISHAIFVIREYAERSNELDEMCRRQAGRSGKRDRGCRRLADGLGSGRHHHQNFLLYGSAGRDDLSEIGRRFPSNPQFPQPEGEELKYIGMVLSEDSLSFPQGEGTEGLRESRVDNLDGRTEDYGAFSETFSNKINVDGLPPIVRDVITTDETPFSESQHVALAVLARRS